MHETSASVQTIRAAVFTAPGEGLATRRIASRAPGPGEVRVRVRCCTICGSDLHTYLGHRRTPTPTVLGHEILGTVESIGSGGARDFEGRPIQPGQRITWSIVVSCGECFFCRHDLPQKCERLFKYGHERLDTDHPLSGGLAEHCLLAAGTTIVPLPDDLPDAVACPANCATSTIAAALRIGRIESGEAVLIMGAGTLGLTAAAMARSLGAARVISCDVNPQRLTMMRRFGATDAVTPDQLAATVRAATDARGVDLALDMSGAISAMASVIPLLRIGGRFVLVGAVFETPDLVVDPETVVRRMLTLTGVHNYTPRDLHTAVQFLATHHRIYPFAELVEGLWSLEDATRAFDHAIAHHSLRVGIRP